MASLSSRVMRRSSWRTRTPTGARECTHGQLAARAALSVRAAAAAVVMLAAAVRLMANEVAAAAAVTIRRGLRRRVRSGVMRSSSASGTAEAGTRRWPHSPPAPELRQYLRLIPNRNKLLIRFRINARFYGAKSGLLATVLM